jgi:hypothetical protein
MWTRFRRWFQLQVDVHWHRYHLLDLRHPGEYDGGWCDRCHVIYLAAFKALKDFVEEEMSDDGGTVGEGGIVSWDEEPWAHAKSEILDLYWWWVAGRRAEWEAFHRKEEDIRAQVGESFDVFPREGGSYSEMVFNDDPLWTNYQREYEALEDKDNRQLERLMAVRKYLWQ